MGGVCDIKPCCCDECYPCDYELIAEAQKLAEAKAHALRCTCSGWCRNRCGHPLCHNCRRSTETSDNKDGPTFSQGSPTIVQPSEIPKQENSLKCHVNEKGGEPKEVTCQPPYDKYCNYIEREGLVTRNCSAGEGLWPQVRCIKTSWFTSCLCKGDNCNAKCTWDNCKKIAVSRSVDPNSDITMYNCDANCKDGEESVDAKDSVENGRDVDEDGGETEKLVVNSKINPDKDALVVESQIKNAKGSNENGRDADEDGRETEKLVVNSKINRAKNTLKVESHVEGAKDSNIDQGNIDGNEIEEEKLFVNSKINPGKDALVVESQIKNVKGSNENGRDVEEDGGENEKVVVNSKINRAKNTLMVESHVGGAKNSNIERGNIDGNGREEEKLVVN